MDMNLLAKIADICGYVGFASFGVAILSIIVGTICIFLQRI